MTKIISSVEEFESLILEDKVSVIDLFATWCGPCRMLAPTIDKISENGAFNVAKVDVDELESIAIRYRVNTIPTLLYFKKGELKEKKVGLTTEEQIIETVEKYI